MKNTRQQPLKGNGLCPIDKSGEFYLYKDTGWYTKDVYCIFPE